MEKNIILKSILDDIDDFFKILQEFVELESPSLEDKAVSDKCCTFLEQKFGELGFSLERIKQTECGDHLYGEFGTGEKSAMIVGHYDTVYPIGTIKKMPYSNNGDKAFGPGILDMKSGIIMAYFAIKKLLENDLFPNKKIGIFFNSDEESGSFYSSDKIIEKGKDYKSVLVMEPGIDGIECVKTHRYGRGTYRITAHGNAAHSGSDVKLGISPLTELAHQLLYFEKLNEKRDDVTFSPTFIQGGIDNTCVIPEDAGFVMDVRYKTEEVATKVHDEILNIKPYAEGITLDVKGEIDKPVMIASNEMFEIAKNIAKDYQLELEGVSIGGGSDGNFTAAAGIPTLDGLGGTGRFLHNPKEYINVKHVPKRIAILSMLLCEL